MDIVRLRSGVCMLALGVFLLFALSLVVKSAAESDEPPAVTVGENWAIVDRLRGDTIVAGQDQYVELIRPGGDTPPVATLSRAVKGDDGNEFSYSYHNTPLGVAGRAFLASDGNGVYRISPTGDVQQLVKLSDLPPGDDASRLRLGTICDSLAATPNCDVLYFGVRVDIDQLYACRYAVETKALSVLALGSRARDMEFHGETVVSLVFCSPEGNVNTKCLIKTSVFGKPGSTEVPVSGRYSRISLDPEGTRVLLDPSMYPSPDPIAIVELDSGTVTRLPVSGVEPVWRNSTEILYGSYESFALNLYDTKTGAETVLCRVAGKRPQGWDASAVVSSDGVIVAWRWVGENKKTRGTLLLDLKNKQALRMSAYMKNFDFDGPDGPTAMLVSAQPWWHQMQILHLEPREGPR